MSRPTPDRIYAVFAAIRGGRSTEDVHALTGIDPWFLHQFHVMAETEKTLKNYTLASLPAHMLRSAKREGVSDTSLADWFNTSETTVRKKREEHSIFPSYLRVDTCAGEFRSHTPYLYSTYESHCEANPSDRKKVMILGSGPNRIGQGIEFDYCCCHAAFALTADGYETIMVNCNPETVSTDYDTADRLYFEPLSLEHVIEVARREQPLGVVVQLGGQTPLKLAHGLEEAGIKIIGTPVDAIDLAEDRGRFSALLKKLDIRQPNAGTAKTIEQALAVAKRIGYPVLVRPSYVLGGTKMRIIYDDNALAGWLNIAMDASADGSVLIDQFLEDAFEYDVDALCDGERVVIAGILEHVEEAGVHSGDSSGIFPAYKFKTGISDEMRDVTRRLGMAIGVRGLMNIQFAERAGKLYVLEVNPRASRTVPFLAKATGVPIVQIATRLMVGQTLDECGLIDDLDAAYFFAKVPVFPFAKFPGADVLLGPEMRSTGEVMGVGRTPGEAYLKAMRGAGVNLPDKGRVFLSVNRSDKVAIVPIARALWELGFELLGTRGTALALFDAGIPTQLVYKVNEGSPNAPDFIEAGKIDMVINTPLGAESRFDEKRIRLSASDRGIPVITTLTAAEAVIEALLMQRGGKVERFALQDWAG